ncbi:MAG TPA: phosphodiester glycosidase family protein [Candidatus Hydrogenedentes bacterium]|nr:phosphodiester glycosidase family protein [Candidatus Hydrogenedentota bacterium]HRT20506.1 phosphodiester glycosidase family protein [Candidatus Hydrogenedentota bacterium]HRT65289.1 phosphodiester glycosidase family protein [Candidatus Hydrogenedentota bacterium]
MSAVLIGMAFVPLSGCVTHADQLPEITVAARIADYRPAWQPLFKGVDFAQGRIPPPEPLACYAARISLREPKVSFLVTPSNGEDPKETDGSKTSTFLRQFHCQLAINASPFSPVEEGEGKPKDILGLSASRGDVYSRPHSGHGAMLISKEKVVSFVETLDDTAGVYDAVSGFGMLLKEGVNTGSGGPRHPRTAAGVSQDGRYLYLLVIDGRQPGYSVGATTQETAEWMRQLGAFNAINLDGGGSTEMVLDDGQGNPVIVNRPIHNNIPGMERVNGNNLGVFAEMLRKGRPK